MKQAAAMIHKGNAPWHSEVPCDLVLRRDPDIMHSSIADHPSPPTKLLGRAAVICVSKSSAKVPGVHMLETVAVPLTESEVVLEWPHQDKSEVVILTPRLRQVMPCHQVCTNKNGGISQGVLAPRRDKIMGESWVQHV